MQAIVLVGGEGTRLRPLTDAVPKPALTLVDRPFLAYMVEWLAGHGVDEVVLACGFEPERLRAALGEGEHSGARLTYVTEPEPLGTAGAFR
nr:NTP transferase domain-containing protein [Solirubrobacterales bacterium]